MSEINTIFVEEAQPITEADMRRWMNVVVNAKPQAPVMHPLQIESVEALKERLDADYIDRCRQRQQRRRKHGRSGRFDHKEPWYGYFRLQTGLRCGK